jgi:hypothetical protein
MKVKQHFRSGKEAAVYAVLVLIVLMSLGSCSGGIRAKYEQQAVMIDSLQRELIYQKQSKPMIHLPLVITTISNSGYSIATDSEGKQFMIDCNPEDYRLNQKIK